MNTIVRLPYGYFFDGNCIRYENEYIVKVLPSIPHTGLVSIVARAAAKTHWREPKARWVCNQKIREVVKVLQEEL